MTDTHTDTHTDGNWKVGQYSAEAESAIKSNLRKQPHETDIKLYNVSDKTLNSVDAFCRKTFSQPVRGGRVVVPQKLRLFKMHFFVAALARKALVGRATCIPIVETNSLGCTVLQKMHMFTQNWISVSICSFCFMTLVLSSCRV